MPHVNNCKSFIKKFLRSATWPESRLEKGGKPKENILIGKYFRTFALSFQYLLARDTGKAGPDGFGRLGVWLFGLKDRLESKDKQIDRLISVIEKQSR